MKDLDTMDTIQGTRPLHSLQIQAINGFEPGVREILKQMLSPIPAAPENPVAISKVLTSGRLKEGKFVWTCDASGALEEKTSLLFAGEEMVARTQGLGFSIDIDRSLTSHPMHSPNLEWATSARYFDIICLPQGVIYVARHPLRQIEKAIRRAGLHEPTREMVRSLFEVVEGRGTSNHERLELIASANAFLDALLARDYAAAEGLTHTPIRLRVEAPA